MTEKGYNLNFEKDSCKIIEEGIAKANTEISNNCLHNMRMNAEEACTAIKRFNVNHREDYQHVGHRIFGHGDLQAIKDLSEKRLVIGAIIKDCKKREVCKCCVKEKMARKSFPK